VNFVAVSMLAGDRAQYLDLVFAIAFTTFLLENQVSLFAGIPQRTISQTTWNGGRLYVGRIAS